MYGSKAQYVPKLQAYHINNRKAKVWCSIEKYCFRLVKRPYKNNSNQNVLNWKRCSDRCGYTCHDMKYSSNSLKVQKLKLLLAGLIYHRRGLSLEKRKTELLETFACCFRNVSISTENWCLCAWVSISFVRMVTPSCDPLIWKMIHQKINWHTQRLTIWVRH